MTNDANGTANTSDYRLACTDCSFETTVDGNFLDALDVADGHQKEQGGSPIAHFVNVEPDDD